MSVKAVVFDYGQVISLPQEAGVVGRLAEMAGVEKERFAPALWTIRREYDLGVVDSKGYYKKVLSALSVGIDERLIDEMIEVDLASWKNVNRETVALMEDVKRAGYILGILSNMPHDFLAWARKNLPVFSLPHVSLFSCEHRLLKPEEAIYRKLLSMLSTLGVASPGELVFFDDMVENVKGAESLGINAFLWKDAEDARRGLLSLGVAL